VPLVSSPMASLVTAHVASRRWALSQKNLFHGGMKKAFGKTQGQRVYH